MTDQRKQAGRGPRGPEPAAWTARGVVVETGGHGPATFLGADLIVPSPGVPRLAEILAARDKGVPVLSEIELAYRFLKGPDRRHHRDERQVDDRRP